MDGWLDTSPNQSKGPFARHGIGIAEIAVFVVLLFSFYVKGTAGEDKPMPYDLLLIATMGCFFLFGLRLPRGVAWPALFWGLIFIGYGIGGMGALYMERVQPFMMVSGYLVCSLIFFSCYVYQSPRTRLPVMFWGYTIAACMRPASPSVPISGSFRERAFCSLAAPPVPSMIPTSMDRSSLRRFCF
jgi:hypothetical protein